MKNKKLTRMTKNVLVIIILSISMLNSIYSQDIMPVSENNPVAFQKGKKYGLKDDAGIIIVQAIYSNILEFKEGRNGCGK